MMEIFKLLYEEIHDIPSFEDSLERNFLTIQDFANASYGYQHEQKEDIERFILLKDAIISKYKFQNIESRSFVLILLDLCERFALHSCIPRIIRIIQKNDIDINKRMTAALKYLFPRPTTNDELLAKFDEVCELLNDSILNEEDDSSKALITFLNYYANIINNTNVSYALQAKQNFCVALNSNNYSWLKQIEDISVLDVSNPTMVFKAIENKIDNITTTICVQRNEQDETCLMEVGTNYCNELSHTPSRFLSIRQLSVNHSNGNLSGRGVKPLTTEDEMYEYIKRYGKMHYAKLLSAFESTFPQHFDTPINIVDWGCGQGIATITFLEKYSSANVINITLIDPSEMVLKRAALHCRKFTSNAKIYTIPKVLDDVTISDLKIQSNIPTIHLFSNILDIDDYNTHKLISLVDNALTCKNFFVCVSPYIDDIKSARLNSFMNHFRKEPSFSVYHNVENTKNGDFWECNNSFQNDYFSHGSGFACKSYNSSGCSNKWTRVMKVFSV